MPLPPSHSVNGISWQQRLTVAVDTGIASTVLVAPLFMGGRGPVGRFVLVLCVAITVILWCARQCVQQRARWRMSGAELLLLAGLGFLVLQLIPLPQSILTLLSPQIANLLPLWTPNADPAVHLGTWNQVSLHPFATQNGLSTYIAYAALFFVVYQRFESMEDVQRLLRLIAVATCLMAILGLAQFLLSNGKFLWVFEHVSRDTKSVVMGPFQNQNHFAHLLALGIGPLLWWLAAFRSGVQKTRPVRLPSRLQDPAVKSQFLWIALGAVTFAVLLTFSRGGVVAALLAVVSAVALLSWNRMLSRRAGSVLAIIACLMIVSLSIHGYERLAGRLGTLRDSQSIDELSHGRWALWNAHFQAIPDFWLLGSGVGTHRDVYPIYLAEHFNVEFTHGESGYLQLALETGLLGTGLFLAGVFFAVRWSLAPLLAGSRREVVACAIAIVPSLVASLVHSIGDFVWYIPACMTTTVLLLASACYLSRCCVGERHTMALTNATEPIALPRLAWIATSTVCGLTFAVVTSSLFRPAVAAPRWYEYQRLVRARDAASGSLSAQQDLTAWATCVEATIGANSSDARAHAQLAGLYLQQFDIAQQHSQNPMPLSQIRDAALASEFPSRQELDDWLDIAVGENRQLFDSALVHARQSVRLCPLQGEAYVLLARVAFLEAPDANRKRSYVQQALRVRPYHSRVQFVAGQESLFDGDVETALGYWKLAFRGEREVQDELVRELTAVIPAKDLLDTLAPDVRGLEALLAHYDRASEVESAKVVATYYSHELVERLRRDPDVDRIWALKRLSRLQEDLEASDEAIRFAYEALRLAPADFDVKLRLGRLLVKAGRFSEAQSELQWCARRQPSHAETRKLLAAASRGALLRQADASTGALGESMHQ